MGIVIRQSVKTTIILFAGAVLGALLNYLYTYAFTEHELGFYRMFLTQGVLAQNFILLGCGSVISAIFQKYDSVPAKQRTLLTICFIIPILVLILICIPYFLLEDTVAGMFKEQDIPFVHRYYAWMPPLILFILFSVLLDFYLTTQLRIAASAFGREILLRFVGFALLGLFFIHWLNYASFFILSVLSYIIPLVYQVWLAQKTGHFRFSTDFRMFSRQEYLEIIRFAWYHLLLGVSQNVLGYLDTLMLGQLDKSGVSAVAPYALSLIAVSFMLTPYKAMVGATFAVLNRAYIDKDTPKVKDIFVRSSLNILIIALAMFLLIGLNLPNAIRLLPPGYASVLPITLILMTGRMVDIATGLNDQLISISSHYKFNFRIALLLVLMVFFFNRMFIPAYGVLGAAAGASVSLIIFNIIKLIFLWSKTGIQPFTTKSLIALFCAALTGFIVFFIPAAGNPIIDVMLRSTAIIVIYAAVLWLFKPSEEINGLLYTVLKKKRLF